MTTHHRDLQAHAQEGPHLCQLQATRSVGVYIACKKQYWMKVELLLIHSQCFTIHLHNVRLGQAASKPMSVWFLLPGIDPPNGRPHPP